MTGGRYAKVSHYVPRFLLDNWGNVGKKKHVLTCEKATGRVWAAAAKNLARESGYYDLDLGSNRFTLEPALETLESKVAPVLRQIVVTNAISHLSKAERWLVSQFAAVQFIRGPSFQENCAGLFKSIEELMNAAASKQAPTASASESKQDVAPSDLQMQHSRLEMLRKAPENFAPHFANKNWVLLTPVAGRSFLIGDCPIALQNQTAASHPWMGNIGLMVRGIEIYLPLAPRASLAMFCPSHLERYWDQASLVPSPGDAASHHQLQARSQRLGEVLRDMGTLVVPGEVVDNHNALQANYAERHVFGDRRELGIVEKVVRGTKRTHAPRASRR
ncbi:MAG TPA: hypothetical protein DCY26_12280 [Hyphomonas sp.]|nr:hypothetical protein [Hyphomonas sp.]